MTFYYLQSQKMVYSSIVPLLRELFLLVSKNTLTEFAISPLEHLPVYGHRDIARTKLQDILRRIFMFKVTGSWSKVELWSDHDVATRPW